MSKTISTPSFLVRDIPVYGDCILAPMDGLSDYPFRATVRSIGSAMSYTEFINGLDIVYGHPKLESKLHFSQDERPLVYQIYDNNPARILQAARILRQRNPDIIDINMGCPDKSVAGRGAGVGLMRTPRLIEEIFSSLTRELDIPITGKIRLGWDAQNRNYMDIARIVEQNGGSLLAVHGRTREQAYHGKADWDAIAQVKAALSIPVIANGDVQTAADIERIKAHTGCDGVMIGRAAVKNPWIFAQKNREDITPDVMLLTLNEHLRRSLEFYGSERGLVLFRKFAVHYLSPYPVTREQRVALLTCTRVEDFMQQVHRLIDAQQAQV